MESGSNLSGGLKGKANNAGSGGVREMPQRGGDGADRCREIPMAENLPEGIRAMVVMRRGEYNARRLRSQREVIRDVMLAAADCDTWLTLAELRALTHYGEASISAQLRHLRKPELGAYDVAKRRRDECGPARRESASRHNSTSGHDFLWEYRIAMPTVERRDSVIAMVSATKSAE
jgi:hypothetical protein